jgi:hypothetical protein
MRNFLRSFYRLAGLAWDRDSSHILRQGYERSALRITAKEEQIRIATVLTMPIWNAHERNIQLAVTYRTSIAGSDNC